MSPGAFLILLFFLVIWKRKYFSGLYNQYFLSNAKPQIITQKKFQQFRTPNDSDGSFAKTERSALSDQEKGERFVGWVTERFNPKYFQLLHWRSDKIHKGIYPLSNLHPDLEYEFRLHNKTVRFAVECKWRANYYDGRIQWAKEYQVRNYYQYQRDEKIPVFIVIGVRGSCDDPKDVYIIPLSCIKEEQTLLPYNFLQNYKRSNRDKFFYLDIGSLMLS